MSQGTTGVPLAIWPQHATGRAVPATGSRLRVRLCCIVYVLVRCGPGSVSPTQNQCAAGLTIVLCCVSFISWFLGYYGATGQQTSSSCTGACPHGAAYLQPMFTCAHTQVRTVPRAPLRQSRAPLAFMDRPAAIPALPTARQTFAQPGTGALRIRRQLTLRSARRYVLF